MSEGPQCPTSVAFQSAFADHTAKLRGSLESKKAAPRSGLTNHNRDSGGEFSLLLLGSGGCLLLLTDNIGHQADFHAAVFCAPFCRVVFLNWLILAEADEINFVRRDVVLACEILDHSLCATL